MTDDCGRGLHEKDSFGELQILEASLELIAH